MPEFEVFNEHQQISFGKTTLYSIFQNAQTKIEIVSERQLCEEWGIVTKPEYMTGMRELFNRDGTLIDGYAQEKLESGKKWAFGNSAKEKSWASHLGD